MTDSPQLKAIEPLFQQALCGDGSIADALDALLAATDSRAVGLWRLEGESLKQVGFRAATDMPRQARGSEARESARAEQEQRRRDERERHPEEKDFLDRVRRRQVFDERVHASKDGDRGKHAGHAAPGAGCRRDRAGRLTGHAAS